jgi:aspartate aminotransferase-like enzyme
MGHSCNLTNVLRCVGALEAVLVAEGAPVPTGVAAEAARAAFARS